MVAFYIATGNPGKLREIEELVQEFFSSEKNIQGRAAQNAEEIEKTFEGNAKIKSLALAQELLKEDLKTFKVLADDSGLIVDALGGRPGVHSARYAGDHVAPSQHMEKLLAELSAIKNLEERSARYACALSLLIYKEGELVDEKKSIGYCEGQIAFDQKGDSGFGYDPLFYLPEFKKHMAELSPQEKLKISHRMEAFEKLSL